MTSSRPWPDQDPGRTLHGRRKGRPLGKRQRELFTTLLPRLELVLPGRNSNKDPGTLNLDKLFPGLLSGQISDVDLEIGFGGGEHLFAQARRRPHTGFIGCEPYTNGVAKLLTLIDGAREAGTPVENVRICRQDGRELLAALPDQCLSRIYLLFPDPWPKLRHHKRRFIAPEAVTGLARALVDGGELRVVTDHRGYCRWTLDHVAGSGDFLRRKGESEDWCTRPFDWPQTRYEAKAKAAGRPCYYLSFKRIAGSRDPDAPAELGARNIEKP